MAKKRRVKKNGKVHFKWVTKQGRFAYYYSTYEMMKPINIRLYFGGFFVTKNYKTEYRNLGISLHPNTEEVCYFEITHWIKNDLGFKDVGRIWYKRYGFTLFAGRAEIKDDKNIPDFLESPEKDGWYHLYVVHGGDDKGEEPRKAIKKKDDKKKNVVEVDELDEVCDDMDRDKVGDDVESTHVESTHVKRGPPSKEEPLKLNPRSKNHPRRASTQKNKCIERASAPSQKPVVKEPRVEQRKKRAGKRRENRRN